MSSRFERISGHEVKTRLCKSYFSVESTQDTKNFEAQFLGEKIKRE
jgi:hypothetical protein